MSKAYIAQYPLNKEKNDLDEIILKQDTYWSPEMSKFWDGLIQNRKDSEPMIQGWYSNNFQTICIASTNQPYKLV